jgi:hypothetical protein
VSFDLPAHYFRVRENGATVYRVDTTNRERRLELNQIAVVNLKKGEIRAHGEAELTAEDEAAIRGWMADREALLARRAVDDILRTVDHLNMTAQWAQAQASEAELDAVTDALLLAMHDLRSVLVRKKADRLGP